MGMEIPVTVDQTQQEEENSSLRSRPSIFLVGPRNVGKRSILQRLLSTSTSTGSSILSSGVTCLGWTIDTKYYTADVCIWIARIDENQEDDSFKIRALSEHCEALVMVFDLSDFTSFQVLQEWVSGLELEKFDILLCVGNKADRVPDHFGHSEYRRKLQKRGESSSDPHPEFWEYGIHQNDGVGLLEEEGLFLEERRQSCIEWCTDRGIEYVEACAVNEMFDQCMSVNGDSQGLARILGALSAHMWPGMVMKIQNRVSDANIRPTSEESSSDTESEYVVEYELLSNGSAEPWDGEEGPWSFSTVENPSEITVTDGAKEELDTASTSERLEQHQEEFSQVLENDMNLPSSNNSSMDAAAVLIQTEGPTEAIHRQEVGPSGINNLENGMQENREHSYDDLEQLMQEMSVMRENLRLMPDSYRREMAAHLAMRMASMFEDDEDKDAHDID